MFLRTYRPNDKRPLQQLFFHTVHTVNSRDYTPEQLDAWAPVEADRWRWSQLDDQFCFVVECQRVLVGFAGIRNDGVLNFLYVHPDFQGRGIATALFKQVERLARKQGLPFVHTVTGSTARGFFEKKGFVLLREVQEIQAGVAFLHYEMAKALSSPASLQPEHLLQPG